MGGIKMNCKVVQKYWYRTELKGLNEKRILDIIKLLELWEGNLNDC